MSFSLRAWLLLCIMCDVFCFVLFCAFIPVITYTRMYVFDAYLLVAFPVAVSTLLALEMETT